MSRIGKKIIIVPEGVNVDVAADNTVTVTGPKGTLTKEFNHLMKIAHEGNEIIVSRPDDENLSKTEATLKALSAAKKVQTCDLMLSHLKENIEFMMLDKAGFDRVKKQLTALVRTMDSSTRLLFAQNIAATNTDDGNSMIELLFDVFESDLIEMLDLSDQTRNLIEGSK